MNSTKDQGIGCLDTFKPIKREHRSGGTTYFFEFSFKEGTDPGLARDTATGLSIAHILGRHA